MEEKKKKVLNIKVEKEALEKELEIQNELLDVDSDESRPGIGIEFLGAYAICPGN